jgi:hypothetical protein
MRVQVLAGVLAGCDTTVTIKHRIEADLPAGVCDGQVINAHGLVLHGRSLPLQAELAAGH